jgi:hypothetical protein
MRLQDKRLEVLARAAGWSAADLAARLQIDLRTLQTLMPDRDYVPGGGLEVVCNLFGLSEDEYSFFSPYVPAEKSPRKAFVTARAEGLARARAVIAERENDRKYDVALWFARNVVCKANKDDRSNVVFKARKHRLGHDRGVQTLKVLAKVDEGLYRGKRDQLRRCRWRRQFEALLADMSLAAIDRLVRNLKRVRFFESADDTNAYLRRRLRFTDNQKCDGMWHSESGTLCLSDNGIRDVAAERALCAHELAHVLDQDPTLRRIRITGRTQWYVAWASEIDCDDVPLTEYARENPCEGFAEFGSLALTDPVLARRAFPLCWALWRAHHLDCDDPNPSDRPTVAPQPLSTADTTPAIAATAADGATAA